MTAPRPKTLHYRHWTGRGHVPACEALGFTVLTARPAEVTCNACRRVMASQRQAAHG